jgi:flagellar basal-body rod protein FlgB
MPTKAQLLPCSAEAAPQGSIIALLQAQSEINRTGTEFVMSDRPMFVERLINQGNAPLVERYLRFTSARHRLLSENIVNASTPGYRQKDLSLGKFQKALQERAAERASAPRGSVRFDDIDGQLDFPQRNILFHDGNNRSMEQLMSEHAKNALMHQMAVELLRKQFSSLENALRERIQ